MAEKKQDILTRGYLVFAVFILFGLLIIGRVAWLQTVQGEYWSKKADSLTLSYRNIQPMRGNIYAADGSLLATSLPRYDVHVDFMASGLTGQLFSEQVDSLALCLSGLFGDKSVADYKRLLKEARRDKERYFLLRRNISYREQVQLKSFPLFRLGKNKGGLIVDQLSRREKPFKVLAARTIGYKLENENKDAVGIEGAYDQYLSGTAGKRLMQRIAGGVWKPVNNENEIEPNDGSDVITTIDLNLQDVAENALLQQLRTHNADMGCAILMEVKTGHIKAIANLKRTGEEGTYTEDFNYAIGHATEPGSTFKLASVMAAMEDGYANLDDPTDTYGGVMNLANGIKMRDSHEGGYGRVSLKKAFAVSSNVGITNTILKYYRRDPQQFINRLRSMYVAEPLNLQLSGESPPRLKNTKDKDWSGVSLPFISIGYETVMSPLQILTFYNAVANEGKMVQPLFVKEIRNKGQLVKKFETRVIADSICSAATIKKARLLLEEVVQTGTASHIRHAQYSIAGKTGTAQIAQGSGGYKLNKVKYQASFCGYFPADNPLYSCIVVVYAPGNNVYYGASVACPVFKDIADKVYALNTNMHQQVERVPDSIYAGLPVVKAGRALTAARVARNLEVVYNGVASGWINDANQPFTTEADKVPNVTGMGLKDALYLLESQGLQVKPMGRGAVKKQSIRPGTPVQKGQQIIIELS